MRVLVSLVLAAMILVPGTANACDSRGQGAPSYAALADFAVGTLA